MSDLVRSGCESHRRSWHIRGASQVHDVQGSVHVSHVILARCSVQRDDELPCVMVEC